MGAYSKRKGPPEAEKLLRGLQAEEAVYRRVCWLIARHHTSGVIVGADYQIPGEADFLTTPMRIT